MQRVGWVDVVEGREERRCLLTEGIGSFFWALSRRCEAELKTEGKRG